MMAEKPEKKKGFDKLGYGALALYASAVAVMGLGVYGINMSTAMMDQTRSDRAREQVKTGRMVVSTADRSQCRSIRFDNETAELGRETVMDCDVSIDPQGGSHFSIIRDGFTKR